MGHEKGESISFNDFIVDL